ncbi:hypothetical protein OIU84_021423 [Salix udensis]|uniref:Uncharacterized protein n=1 Tax=Salix udensis TaxID=889485 RepID=A0AAD6KW34_9ROSI|nr:hypothetical protein OIU84_021423 [Salix udensis]
MESQKEISKAIQNDVNAASENLTQIGSDLWQLQCLVSGLDGKIGSLEEKQDIANMGVMYLCNFVGGKNAKMPKALEHIVKLSCHHYPEVEDQFKPSGRTRASLTYSEVPSLTGLKELADDVSQTFGEPAADAIPQDGTDNLEDQLRTPHIDKPRALLRQNNQLFVTKSKSTTTPLIR